MDDLEQAIEVLRSLNESVPKPIPLPSETDIETMEHELGITFNRDYREFLIKASDVVLGAIEPATITVPESYTHLPTVIESAREYGVPDNLFPFCEDNADFYCFNSSGEVVFWSHNGSINEKWPNLSKWIQEVWVGENV